MCWRVFWSDSLDHGPTLIYRVCERMYRDYHIALQFKAARDSSEQAGSVLEFKPEPTAEIDVELSDGESDEPQHTTALKNKLRRESDEEPLSEHEDSYEPGAQGMPGREF